MGCGQITAADLKRRQSFPLDVKVKLTQERIREFYEELHGLAYISFSGGKDSTVLLDMVKGMYPDVPAVYCDTGVEDPEARKFALSKADKVLRPKRTFREVIDTFGYPFPSKEQARYIHDARHGTDKLKGIRLSDGNFSVSKKWRYLISAPFEVSAECCRVMKHQPFERYETCSHRWPYVAMMASESMLRKQSYINHGCNWFEGHKRSMPMAFWTEQDVMRYIVENNLEYASCYGEIVEEDGELRTTRANRTGCTICMFGVDREPYPNRFERMEKERPKLHAHLMENVGMSRVLDYCGVPYSAESRRRFG